MKIEQGQRYDGANNQSTGMQRKNRYSRAKLKEKAHFHLKELADKTK